MAWTGRSYRAGEELGSALATLMNARTGYRDSQGLAREAVTLARRAKAENLDPEEYAANLGEIYARYGMEPDEKFRWSVQNRASSWEHGRALREREAELARVKGEKEEERRRLEGETEKKAGWFGRFVGNTMYPPEAPPPDLPPIVEQGADQHPYYQTQRLRDRTTRTAEDAMRAGVADDYLKLVKPEGKDAYVIGADQTLVDRSGRPLYSGKGKQRDLKTYKPGDRYMDEAGNWQTVPGEVPGRPKSELGKLLDEMGQQPQGSANFEYYRQAIQKTVGTTGGTELSKLIAERDALPKGHPNRRVYDSAIQKVSTRQERGLHIRTNPDGTVEVAEGTGGGPGLTKVTRNAVEKSALEAGETLQRLKALERDFDAGLQQVGPRLRSAWSGIKAKVNGKQSLTPEETSLKQRVTIQRRRAYDILNNELNRLSGAAVNEHEMARLTKGLPNPGTGVFDGDDPVEFEEKFRDTLQSIRSAMARLSYIRRHGLQLGSVALDDMPALMNRRGNELTAQLKARGMPEAQAIQQARETLAEEFGLLPGGR
jgi:hypothetical protein